MLPPARRAVSKGPVAVVAVIVVVAAVAGVALVAGSSSKSSTTTPTLCCPGPSLTTSSASSTVATSSASTSTSTSTSSTPVSSSNSSSSSSSSATSTSSATHSSTSLVDNATFISDLNADVSGLDVKNLNYNDSFYQGNDFYSGPAGFAFDAEIQIIYNQCTGQCPTVVTNVTTIEPGFVVQVNLPIQATALGTTGEEFDFTVTVTPPSGNYNGQLVFFCTMAQ